MAKKHAVSIGGFGLIETLAGALMLMGIVLGAFAYFTSIRSNSTKLASKSSTIDLTATIGSQITSRISPSSVLNNPEMCNGSSTAVPPSATAVLDPFCCTEAGVPTYCNALRRNILCGRYGTASADTQNIRSSATWARNFYSSCMGGTAAPCNITDNGGSICSDDGLVFDSPFEISNFLSLLPDPYTGTLPANQTPREIRFKIEAVDTTNLSTPIDCGTEPNWTIRHALKLTLKIIMSAQQNNATQDVNMLVTWPGDSTLPTAVAGANTYAQTAGHNNQVSVTHPTSGQNADNSTVDSLTNASYFRNGNVRANAQCVATKSGAGTSQPGAYEYSTDYWRKLVYQVQGSENGITLYCRNAYTANSADMSACCETINNGDVGSGAGAGIVRAVWNDPFNEGDILAISIVDSQGNIGTPKNFIFSPGYCPPMQSYCADGSRTGPEVAGQAAALYPLAGPGATCAELPTWPAYTDNIACHPHDGCFGLCSNGNRAGQNCPATTTTYCNVTYNFDPTNNRGCGAGIDCTLDRRCNDAVCDDCGYRNCPTSTLAVTEVNRATPPYNDTANWPTPFLGVPGGAGGCPNTDTYCPTSSPYGLSVVGSDVSYLPKDNCGNSCPDGTRPTGTNCNAGIDDCGRACP